MKNYLIPVAALLLSGMALPLQAQVRDSVRLSDSVLSNDSTRLIDADWRLGFDLGATRGAHSSTLDQLRTQARAYLRHQFLYPFQAEFGVGIGRIAGDGYDTRVLPIDLRGMWAPIVNETFNPYVYVGVGGTYYDHLAPEPPPGGVSDGWALALPIGVGLQYKPKSYPTFAYDFAVGYNLMFSDEVNSLTEGGNDSYLGAMFGFEFLLDLGPNDSDGDGLSNAQESRIGTEVRNPDTDGDGLSDAEEVNVYRTNPLQADSDADGLTDSMEIGSSRTNPVVADTDRDGVLDGVDVCPFTAGTVANKGCPADTPVR